MTKRTRKIYISIIIICILIITFTIDYILVIQMHKKPFFSIKIAGYNDGGSAEYLGLFYKVIIYNKWGQYGYIGDKEIHCLMGYYIGPITASIDKVLEEHKDEFLEYTKQWHIKSYNLENTVN